MTDDGGLRALPDPDGPPDLRAAVADALAQMDWLTPADAALRALALRQAAAIEDAADRAAEWATLSRAMRGDMAAGERLRALEDACDAAEQLRRLGPQLQATLQALGASPLARRRLDLTQQKGARLAQLRAAAGQHHA